MHYVFHTARKMTGVLVLTLTALFNETDLDEEDDEFRIPVPELLMFEGPPSGCTPRYLEA
jgi:hypothetical protein